jgi:hypothetical protein
VSRTLQVGEVPAQPIQQTLNEPPCDAGNQQVGHQRSILAQVPRWSVIPAVHAVDLWSPACRAAWTAHILRRS